MNTKFPVSFDLNTPQNRLPVDLSITSDLNSCFVSLYECRGVYWFSLGKPYYVNSSGFVSLRNCVSSLKSTVLAIGFTIDNSKPLAKFVSTWERSIKSAKGVA